MSALIELIHLVVPGPAVGAARPRVVRLKNGASHTFMPDKPIAWQERCRQIAASELGNRRQPHTGPVILRVDVYTSAPKLAREHRKRQPKARALRPGTGKPDLDNVVKLAMDALTLAGVWSDDRQVAQITAARWWIPIGDDGADLERERVEITAMVAR